LKETEPMSLSRKSYSVPVFLFGLSINISIQKVSYERNTRS